MNKPKDGILVHDSYVPDKPETCAQKGCQHYRYYYSEHYVRHLLFDLDHSKKALQLVADLASTCEQRGNPLDMEIANIQGHVEQILYELGVKNED